MQIGEHRSVAGLREELSPFDLDEVLDQHGGVGALVGAELGDAV